MSSSSNSRSSSSGSYLRVLFYDNAGKELREYDEYGFCTTAFLESVFFSTILRDEALRKEFLKAPGKRLVLADRAKALDICHKIAENKQPLDLRRLWSKEQAQKDQEKGKLCFKRQLENVQTCIICQDPLCHYDFSKNLLDSYPSPTDLDNSFFDTADDDNDDDDGDDDDDDDDCTQKLFIDECPSKLKPCPWFKEMFESKRYYQMRDDKDSAYYRFSALKRFMKALRASNNYNNKRPSPEETFFTGFQDAHLPTLYNDLERFLSTGCRLRKIPSDEWWRLIAARKCLIRYVRKEKAHVYPEFAKKLAPWDDV